MTATDNWERRALAAEVLVGAAAEAVGTLAASYHRHVCSMDNAYWECAYPSCQNSRAVYLRLKATPAEAQREGDRR